MTGPPRVLVWLRDPDDHIIGPLQKYTGIDGVLRWNDVDTATVTAPLYGRAWRMAEPGCSVWIAEEGSSEPIFTGDMEEAEIEVTGPGVGTISASFLSYNDILASRTAYPTPGSDVDSQTSARDILLATVDSTILRHYVDVNAGPGALAGRRELVLEDPDPGLGVPIDAATRFDSLLDLLQSLAVAGGGLGFRVSRTLTGQPTFEVFEPRDLSSTVWIGFGARNMRSGKWKITAPKATRVISGGKGEMEERSFMQATDAAAEARWRRRRELFYDIRSVDDPGKQQQDTNTKLAESAETEEVSVEVRDGGRWRYGRDYRLGDRVTVEIHPTITTKQVVREVRFQVGKAGITYTPKVGSEGTTATPRDMVAVRELSRRVSALETGV